MTPRAAGGRSRRGPGRRETGPRGRGPDDHDGRADRPVDCRGGTQARSRAPAYRRRDDLEPSGEPGCHTRCAAPPPDGTPRHPSKLADRTVVDVLPSARHGALRRRRWRRPRDPSPRLISCGPDQGRPLRTMGLTATTVEIAGGEVGDFVAEHLEKHRDRRHRERRGQANHATLEMDPSQRPAKLSAPLDSHALLKASEPPAARAVSQQTLNVHLNGAAGGRRHAQEANTSWVWWSPAESGMGTFWTGSQLASSSAVVRRAPSWAASSIDGGSRGSNVWEVTRYASRRSSGRRPAILGQARRPVHMRELSGVQLQSRPPWQMG